MANDYFQVRKNQREVIRIFRSDYEGLDITRIQLWYKDRKTEEYMPGKIIPFASDVVPGIIEGLVNMAHKGSPIALSGITERDSTISHSLLEDKIYSVLERHKQPMHWDNIVELLKPEIVDSPYSNWTIYNLLLSRTDLFNQIEDDVFESV